MATAEVIQPNEGGTNLKLSANAKEFCPSETPVYDGIHLCIFNDGVPSLVLASEADATKILHGITDDAIDEGFPPTAEEAAELEAVEEFVKMMASFDKMEEREERARDTFDHVKKRWETRRAEGLVGRPKPAKHSVELVDHTQPSPLLHKDNSSLVLNNDRHAHRMLMKHQKLHQKDLELRSKPNRRATSGKQSRQPIHQPRKAN